MAMPERYLVNQGRSHPSAIFLLVHLQSLQSSPSSIFVAGSYMLDGRMLGRGHDRRMIASAPAPCQRSPRRSPQRVHAQKVRDCALVAANRPPTAHSPPSPPLPPLLPLLPVGRRPLFLVVLLLDLGPVGGEHRAARRLEGLVHRTSCLLGRVAVDLLEELVQRLLPLGLLLLLCARHLAVNGVPVAPRARVHGPRRRIRRGGRVEGGGAAGAVALEPLPLARHELLELELELRRHDTEGAAVRSDARKEAER
mmetsp:Transcript_26948/g.78579  ORF Transcript_26948/g.78579 Transcript_26948/m.78579 type:complete len:253 (-) Transcript_26948:716-1474(-)